MKSQLMTAEEIRDSKVYLDWGLSEAEYQAIQEQLGRLPNYTETGIYSGMWSEHCSYKSSKAILKNFYTEGEQVIQGPGEGAGIIDIGDDQGIVFKMESHNSPSALEPYEGAATGLGGVVRDVFSMGATPIAGVNSLRFGDLKTDREKYLVTQAVQGIADYGNILGLPTLAGEVKFDTVYAKRPLVNAMCVGLIDTNKLHKGVAAGEDNVIIYVGSSTGRDGIHGASFSSKEVDEKEGQGSAVQAGDPFKEKVLIDAYLKMLDLYQDDIVGMQDMGAAGIVSSSSEMADKGQSGIELNMDDVPTRENRMTAYEILLSESQERMLLCVKKGAEDKINQLFKSYGLHSAVIGRVTTDGQYRVFQHGEVVVDVPVESLSEGVPSRTYEAKDPKRNVTDGIYIPEVKDVEKEIEDLLSSPDIASAKALYSQFDSHAGNNTLVSPSADAGLIRIEETDKAVAMTADCNSRYVYLNPKIGGQIAISECARNIVATGATPLGATDCLNFGNPENPEVYFEFRESCSGISKACEVLNTPIVSGNVSLNNGGIDQPIYPTPTIGMIGLIKDYNKILANRLTNEDQLIYVIGETKDDYAGSVIQKLKENRLFGDLSHDLTVEKAHQAAVLKANEDRLLSSAHDISEGGLLIALLEMSFETDYSFEIEVDLTKAQLFSESQSRFIVTVDQSHKEAFEKLVENLQVTLIGRTTTSSQAVVNLPDETVTLDKENLEIIWGQALSNQLS